jgi:DNA mismatch repair ATPase MutL
MLELSLHILDLVQNSLTAGATRVEIRIEESLQEDRLAIEIQDNTIDGRREPLLI